MVEFINEVVAMKHFIRWILGLAVVFGLLVFVLRLLPYFDGGILVVGFRGGTCVDFSGGRSISLSKSESLCDEDLAFISSDEPLFVDVSYTNIGDLGIKYLDKVESIKRLNVEGTSVSPIVVKGFLKSHPRCCIKSGIPGQWSYGTNTNEVRGVSPFLVFSVY